MQGQRSCGLLWNIQLDQPAFLRKSLTSHFLQLMRCWPKVRIGASEFGIFKGVANKNKDKEEPTSAMQMLPVDVPSSHVE